CSKVHSIKDPSCRFLKKLSCPDALYMVRRVSDEEIKLALFDIDGNEAPGPDGFSS
nr:RNA-directed DNA polymerase, eukaryota, reverse transcriptase zinc-binding domain protein [Tanacetum cinerariifolium]